MLIYAILIFIFIVGGTLVIYSMFGKSGGGAEVQRVKDRLLGKSKPEKSQSGSGEAPSLIKSDEPTTSLAQKLLDNLKLAERVEAMLEKPGLRWTSGVLLQKRTGGNLSELLDKLATIIRERFKLRGKIKAISAHGRITATTLSLIPAGVAFLMFYSNRDYIEFFVKDPTGNQMAGAAIF